MGTSGKGNRWTASAVLVALMFPLVVMALRSEGYHATKLDLNDAGIWTVNASLGSVGRINTQINALEVALPSPESQNFDVSQVDDSVLLQLPGRKQVVPVDVALAKLGDPITLPDNGQLQLGGPTAAMLDPAKGKVWTTARNALRSISPQSPPQIEAGDRSVMAVGIDGSAYVYSATKSAVESVSVGGERGSAGLADGVAAPTITVVGATPVVLDSNTGKLLVPGQRPVDLSSLGGHPVLQLPGGVASEVIVATDTSLVGVTLAGGALRTLTKAGTRLPTAPVALAGCVRGAWAGTPTFAQFCDGSAGMIKPIDNMGTQPRLAFRVNRGRVILNDMQSGANLLFTPQDPIKVDNWNDALNRDDKQGKNNEKVVEKPKTFDCGADAKAPEPKDDVAGTRPGRPVIVRVLANDVIPDCVVPQVAIADADQPPLDEGVATVVNGGRDIQVTPAAGSEKSIELQYKVTGSTGEAQAHLRVDVVPLSTNHPPVPEPDRTTVQAGKSVRINVLENDTDPEGDALTLTGVTSPDGTVTFRANGDVTYTSSGAAAGTKTLAYTVADEQGLEAQGQLTVNVLAPETNVAPTARADQLNAFVGRDTSVNVLANDSDPADNPITVSQVEQPAGLGLVWNERGEVRVHPTQAGTTTVTYQITNGEKEATGRLRIDAFEPGTNHPPIAVRDDVVARSGLPTLADLVANDIDIDGDVLAVTAVNPPPDSGLSVELLDMHMVRVTAPAGFVTAVQVPYTVTDGMASSAGVLVVRPFKGVGVDQPPTAGPDDVSVRAGNVTAIKVLANDVDPEGERLTLTGAGGRDIAGKEIDGQTPLPPDQGQLFIEGEQLRYRAPATGPLTIKTSYTVEDPAGNRTDGLLTIHVSSSDPAQNRPPDPPQIEARVFAGASVPIRVPLIGLDPDGDPVALIGVVDPPAKGQTAITAEGFVYTADQGAAGTDTFTFTVRDSLGLEATGRVRIAVVARPSTNSNPVAVPDRATVRVGQTMPIPVLANDSDPDGDPISLLTTGKDAPTKPHVGTVTIDPDGKQLDFSAPADATDGSQSFSYSIADGRGGSARGVVTVKIVTVAPPNELPIARDDFVKPQKPGSNVEVDVLANDRDPDGDIGQAKVAVLDTPSATVGSGGKVQVKVGDSSLAFIYELTDAAGGKARAVVSIPVVTSLPPACDTQTGKVKAGETISVDVLKSCTDPFGAPIELVRVDNARGGTVQLDGSKASFTAANEVRGEAGFSFLVSNGKSQAVGGVRLEVTGQNFPPTFDNSSVEVPAGGERSIDLTKLTHDLNTEDKHTYTELTGATDKVQATISGTTLTVKAADDAKGASTSLAFKVSDEKNSVPGQIAVQVLAHDGAPPTAVDDTAETDQGVEVKMDLTANDSDPVGQGLTITIKDTQGGSATISDPKGVIIFKPDASFFGTATLTYEIRDVANDPARASSATAKITVYGFPDKVPAPTRTKQESHQVSLQWGTPSSNGAPITGYVVETNQSTRTTCPSTTCVIAGLTNGQAYKFRVAAKNRAVKTDADLVFGDESPEYKPDEIPSTPATPTLKFGDQKIDVTWAAPQNNGTPIAKYLLRIAGGTSSETRELPPTPTTYSWTGLTNGVSYKFSIAAANGAEGGGGKTDFSPLTNDPVNSIPAAKPGVVPAIVAQRSDKDRTAGGWVIVVWGAPQDNGDPNLTYDLTVSPPDVAPIAIKNAVPQPTPVGGLKNGVSYTFAMTATNKAGTGPEGTSNAAVPAALPSPIGSVSAVPGDRLATLAFSAPNGNGGDIMRWEISANGSAAARFTVSSTPTQGNPVQVTVGTPQLNLANGISYTFAVSACNVVGCGPAVTSNSVIPFGAPVVTWVASGGTITWSWPSQPGVSSYTFSGPAGQQNGNSYVYNAGTGPARGYDLTVVAMEIVGGQTVTQSSGAVHATTIDTRALSISHGVSAGGMPTDSGKPCVASCFWVVVQLNSYLPNTTYSISCRTDWHSTAFPGGTEFKSFTIQTDGNGNATSRNGNTAPGAGCIFGYSGSNVWVEADGLLSNQLAG